VISPYQSEERRKFTIAHELGHLFLHMGYLLDSDLWSGQDEKISTCTDGITVRIDI
jgi:Zn-dependent peptidase ImmA (M78 family)